MDTPALFFRLLSLCLLVVLAAALTFVWGMLFWTNPLPYRVLKSTPDGYTAGSALLESFPESGTYMIPGFDAFGDNLDPLRNGPLAMLHLNREGELKPVKTLVRRGFVLNLLVIAVLALLLWQVLPGHQMSYLKRVCLVTGFGAVSAVFSHGADVIWWFHPMDWHLVVLLYTWMSWLVIGLILAIDPERFLRKKTVASPTGSESNPAAKVPPSDSSQPGSLAQRGGPAAPAPGSI